jgi:mono/diheme cytochrome c family protein
MRGIAGRRDGAAIVLLLALAGCEAPPEGGGTGNPDTGRAVIASVGCGVCHQIPGVPGATGIVGPSLRGFAQRTLIGGTHVNEPRVLVGWVRNAPELSPDTGMPRMPLGEHEARDVAAYLYTLR